MTFIILVSVKERLEVRFEAGRETRLVMFDGHKFFYVVLPCSEHLNFYETYVTVTALVENLFRFNYLPNKNNILSLELLPQSKSRVTGTLNDRASWTQIR